MTAKKKVFETAICKYDKEPIYRIGKGPWLHYTEFDGDLFHEAKPTATPVEPKAQVESASVGAISDHEKGQKEEFYKFQQHLEKTQEEISKWPSWMREAGRASMGLDQREPKEVESGGLPDRLKQQCPRCGGEGAKQERGFASAMDMDAGNEPHLITKSCYLCRGKGFIYPTQEELIEELQASLLREKELRELLGKVDMKYVRETAAKYVQLEADFDSGKVGGVKSLALLNISSALGEYIIKAAVTGE